MSTATTTAPASKVPYTVTARAVSVLYQDRMRVVPSDSPNFGKLVDALRTPSHDLDLIGDLVDIGRFVARATFGAVQIADDQVQWNGEKVANVVADRLIQLLRGGHDLEPLSNFLGRLMQNPLESARSELYLWLELGNAPITPDGFFLAFKKVRADYRDIYSGKFDNSVGQVCEMPREEVDPDRSRTCSVGLHFCSYGYLAEYGTSDGNRVMIVQVDPADVVAIPHDYNNQKGRTWKYMVIGEVPPEEAAQFFSRSPLVEPYVSPHDGVVIGADTDLVEAVKFEDGAEVIFIGDEDDADTYSLTVNKDYALESGTDGDGDIYLADDEDFYRYAPARLFKLAHDPVENTGTAIVPGSEFCNTVVRQDPVEAEDDAPVPEQAAGKAELLFKSGGRSFLAHEVLSLVKEHGQRGMQRLTGVPRTTIQEWLKAISAQSGD